jgi:hypothetical protein
MFAQKDNVFCHCEERLQEATWQSLQPKSTCQKRLLRFARNDILSRVSYEAKTGEKRYIPYRIDKFPLGYTALRNNIRDRFPVYIGEAEVAPLVSVR